MIKKLISSPVVMLVLILEYALLMGIATFVERDHGVEVSRKYIYHNIGFIILQLLLTVNALAIIKCRGLFSVKRLGVLLFHLSFVVIFLGALITHLFSVEGIMHIREGKSANYFVNSANNQKVELDFTVHLTDFVLTRYPGSSSPSSYESFIEVEQDNNRFADEVRMNKIVNIDGYRLFQTSFDKDEKGTVLTVNYDVPGMHITYLGYALLLLGIIITPFQRNSRFRLLNRRLKSLGAMALFILFGALPSFAAKNTVPSVSEQHAAEFGHLLIQDYKGRLEPINTWSSKILRKIHGSNEYNNFSPEQVLLNLLFYPHEWSMQDIIRVKNKDVRNLVGCNEYTNYNTFFTNNNTYKLQNELNKAYNTPPAQRGKFAKDIISIDEVINIIYQIQLGDLLPIFPNPKQANAPWLSPSSNLKGITGEDSLFLSKITLWYAQEINKGVESGDYNDASKVLGMIKTYQDAKNTTIKIDAKKIKAEILYNNLNIFGRIFKFYLIAGGMLLVLSIINILNNQSKVIKYLQYMLLAVIVSLFAFHTYGLILRWHVSEHGPWSNSYETMVFVAWSVAVIGITFFRRAIIISSLTSILAGILLFVSSLNWANPEITPLVPVLQSYWLMIHVSVIMLGYGFYFVCALIGLTNLILYALLNSNNKHHLAQTLKKTTIINEMAMILGTFLMCLGIFIGAVWANVSWGRYWGWDPKETWALITMMLYVAALHIRFVPKLNSLWLFNVSSLWLILSVLMTYFGVNHYLSGLHSYGSSGGNLFSTPLIVGLIVLVIVAIISMRGRKHIDEKL